MIINDQILPKTQGSHIKVKVQCDRCFKVYETEYRNIFKCRHKRGKEIDYCWQCAVEIAVSTEEYKKKMSLVQIEKYKNNPEIKDKISKTLKDNKVNVGEKNGMKSAEARLKVSNTRKMMFKDGRLSNDVLAKQTSEAWASGKYDGARVGQCEWFDFVKKDGTLIKCQGTWELAFAKWADDKNLTFETHKKRIPYKDENGFNRNYYPDFFVKNWDCYVDIKNDYHWNLQKEKFQAIEKSNPDIKLKILLKEDLIKLGVVL